MMMNRMNHPLRKKLLLLVLVIIGSSFILVSHALPMGHPSENPKLRRPPRTLLPTPFSTQQENKCCTKSDGYYVYCASGRTCCQRTYTGGCQIDNYECCGIGYTCSLYVGCQSTSTTTRSGDLSDGALYGLSIGIPVGFFFFVLILSTVAYYSCRSRCLAAAAAASSSPPTTTVPPVTTTTVTTTPQPPPMMQPNSNAETILQMQREMQLQQQQLQRMSMNMAATSTPSLGMTPSNMNV